MYRVPTIESDRILSLMLWALHSNISLRDIRFPVVCFDFMIFVMFDFCPVIHLWVILPNGHSHSFAPSTAVIHTDSWFVYYPKMLMNLSLLTKLKHNKLCACSILDDCMIIIELVNTVGVQSQQNVFVDT